MKPPNAESKTLQDLFNEGLKEEVNYESDTEFVVEWEFKMAVVLPTLRWRPDDRLTEGYPNSGCKAFLNLFTRRHDGRLKSMLIRIVFETGGVAIVWKSSHDRHPTAF